ncbi:kinase-like domain-containing protein [Lineolata rhizophorae]|uniref:Kinase-like domain-containing protein n=1 Tax=Lineolata rhizophorae TaxID=578093 RepID=A0A6A6NZU0_9PEZI|nr:kinase-like domain-containing protein [Lineolata rhizophorae]
MPQELASKLHVATLEAWDGSNASALKHIFDIPVYGNDIFYFGRNPARCRHCYGEPTISNRHLKIYCILFEENFASGISPLVYVEDLSLNGTQLTATAGVDNPNIEYGMHMKRSDAHLLNENDRIRVSESLVLVFRNVPNLRVQLQPLDTIRKAESQAFSDRFTLSTRRLGVGGHGSVLLAFDREHRRQLACKVIEVNDASVQDEGESTAFTKKVGRRLEHIKNCFREVEILRDIDHPNIIAVQKAFWSNNSIYIFQELVTGGDLFSYIEYKGGKLSDVETAVIVRQILIAVDYLHDLHIVHRDLKPDNVLMTSFTDGARVVLTDFGHARYLPTSQVTKSPSNPRMFSVVGTIEYAAPEIYKANSRVVPETGYSKAVDMWSIGSITAAMLSGDVIFIDREHPDFEDNALNVILPLAAACDLGVLDTSPKWAAVGHRPKDFIRNLLVLEESGRMTTKEALAHPWFTNELHAADFDAVYKRAIQNWKPPKRPAEPIEKLNVGSLQDSPSAERAIQNSNHSPFFRLDASPPTGSSPLCGSGSITRNDHHGSVLSSISEEAENDAGFLPDSFQAMDLGSGNNRLLSFDQNTMDLDAIDDNSYNLKQTPGKANDPTIPSSRSNPFLGEEMSESKVKNPREIVHSKMTNVPIQNKRPKIKKVYGNQRSVWNFSERDMEDDVGIYNNDHAGENLGRKRIRFT